MICLDFEWQTNEFMVYCRTTQLREKSMMAYEQTLRLFERWCMEEMKIVTVDKVTENVIRRYIAELQEQGKYTFYANDKQKAINYPERRRDYRKPISTATINNYIRNLRVFFNWLERNYVIKRNPMKRVRQLKANREPKVYLTDDELRKLLSKFYRSYFSEHRDYMMTLLMLDSGMRLGECSTLLVTDLELHRKRINLRAEETKGRRERTVFFSPKTEKAIRRWLQYKDRYPRFFISTVRDSELLARFSAARCRYIFAWWLRNCAEGAAAPGLCQSRLRCRFPLRTTCGICGY